MTHLTRHPSLPVALPTLVAALLIGCGPSSDVLTAAECWGQSSWTPLALDEPGVNGRTPKEVLAFANARLAEQRVRWEPYAGHPRAEDVLYISFGQPEEAHDEVLNPRSVPQGSACAERMPAVRVKVPFELTSASGFVSVAGAEATIEGREFDGELFVASTLYGLEPTLSGPHLDAALDADDAVEWWYGFNWMSEWDGERYVPVMDNGVVRPGVVGLFRQGDGEVPGHRTEDEARDQEDAAVLLGEWLP